MSAASVNKALQCDDIAAYAQKLLDNIKAAALPNGIDPLVESKIQGEISGVQFLAKIFRNTALTAGGTVAGLPTDASGGTGAPATNAALAALLTLTG